MTLLLVSAAAAALMGFAIQRGATCTVAAVGDIVRHRRWGRTIALAEAALWVAAGLLAAQAAGIAMSLPRGFSPTLATVGGGVLLGLGAVLNGACVFGAVARLGSGEWAFAATPLGFFAGCLLLQHLAPPVPPLPGGPPLLDGPWWLAILVAALAGWRAWRALTSAPAATDLRWRRRIADRWTPHAATLTIAACFLVMVFSAGAWAYTNALDELARGMTGHARMQLLLFAALLAGAVGGGWSAGLLGHRRVTAQGLARCFGGGVLMAAGSLLIPGSNDGLILIGLPLLQPYAWLACAVMVLTIVAALIPSTRGRRSAGRSPLPPRPSPG